jgi:hypothetical protein
LALIGVALFSFALNDPLGLVNATVALSALASTIFPSVDTLDSGGPAHDHGRTPITFLALASKYT